MQIGPEAWPWLVASALGLALAAWLAFCGWRSPVVKALVVLLVARAVFDGANGMTLHTGTAVAPLWVLAIATLLLPAAVLGFYAAYRKNRGVTLPWARFVWPAAILLVTIFLIAPGLWASNDGGGTTLGPFFMFYGLNYLLYAVLALDLGRRAVAEIDLKKRRSYLWVGLGFAVLPAYAAASDFLFIDVLKEGSGAGAFFQTTHWIVVGSGVVLLGLFLLLARNALQTADDAHKMDVAAALGVLTIPSFTVLVLWGLVAANVGGLSASVSLEGFWSILHPLMVAIAFARFGAFGLQLRARAGLQWLLFVLVFPLAFGLGWMAGLNSFSDQPTWLVALIFMFLVFPFYRPLRRASGKWADRVLGVSADE